MCVETGKKQTAEQPTKPSLDSFLVIYFASESNISFYSNGFMAFRVRIFPSPFVNEPIKTMFDDIFFLGAFIAVSSGISTNRPKLAR